jgi:hypothetical protein
MISIREFKLNGKVLDDWSAAFRGMELYKAMNSSLSLGTLTFSDTNVELFLGLGLKEGDEFSFRWGYDEKKSSHWHTYAVLNADLDVEGELGTLSLTIVDYSIHYRANSAHSAFVEETQDKLVQSIATGYKSFLPPVTVPSMGKSTYYQTGETDWDFLVKNTAGAVTQGTKVGDYRLFWKTGNELHFHPPDYGQEPYRTVQIMGGSSTAKAKLRVSPFKRALKGGELFRETGFLRDTIAPFSFDAKRALIEGKRTISTRDLRDVSAVSQREGAFHGQYRFNESADGALVEESSTDNLFKAYSDTYELEIYVEGDPRMEPGSLIYVSSVRYNKPVIIEGLWLIESVYHRVEGGQMSQTTARLSRQFLPKGDQTMSTIPNKNRGEADSRLSVSEGRSVSNVRQGGRNVTPRSDQ